MSDFERRMFALRFWAAAREFMEDPANKAGFEEWKARRAGAQPATNETRATPTECPRTGTAATV